MTTTNDSMIAVTFSKEDVCWLHEFLTNFAEGEPMDLMTMQMSIAKEVLDKWITPIMDKYDLYPEEEDEA